MLPYPKFTFDHVHLLSDTTTFLFVWVHFQFRFVKKAFKDCFSFNTIFSSYTFHSYTFFISIFSVCTLFSIPILFIRIIFFTRILFIRILSIRILFIRILFNRILFIRQKQPPKCSIKIHNILRKATVLEPLFNKVAGLNTRNPTHVFSCEYCRIFKNFPSANDCF